MDTEVSMINNVISMTDSQGPRKKTGIGARLKSARESMHMSEKEAAARLYLSVKLITVMESENFLEGPPATFIRGYLHSYARLLDFPESEINVALKALETNLPTPRVTSTVAIKQNPIDRADQYVRWITLGIASVLFLLVAVWWYSNSSNDEMENLPTKVSSVPTTAAAIAAPMTETASMPAVQKNSPQTQTTPVKAPQKPIQTLMNPNHSSTQPSAMITPTTNTPAPVIPLALSAQPDQVKATNGSKSKSTKAKKNSTKATHSGRHPTVQNVVMSLPEPGSD